MTDTVLTLSRHGQTPWHHENRYAGSSDIGLTATGRGQARALGAWAAVTRPDVVACSPQQRSLLSAAPAAAALGVDLLVVEELREVDFGVVEGRTLAEVEQEEPAVVAGYLADPVANPIPGAEPPVEAAERVAEALLALAASHTGGHVLVVGHSTGLRLALCRLLGISCAHFRRVFPRIDNASLTVLRMPADGSVPPALLALNCPLP